VVNRATNYFRVTAVSHDGVESDFSNEESLLVNIVRPGENMLVNGDFSSGNSAWIWDVSASAFALWQVTDGVSHFQIVTGGSFISDIQLRQTGLMIIQGKNYLLEFDAWAAVPRILDVRVEQSKSPGINYSQIQPLTITPVRTRYSYPFTMGSPSDFNAQMAFYAGISNHDVYIDDVSLTLVDFPEGDLNQDGCVDYEDLEILTDSWLQEGSGLPADLNGNGRVDQADYAILAGNWGTCF
jgi:hypothetical protein